MTLGLSKADVDRGAELLGEALSGGRRLTRKECVDAIVAGGVRSAADHPYHFLWYASQIGVTCSGPQVGKEQTFVLLDEWVPEPRRLDRDEALAELARRYFRSHGPTTVRDFAGWTGLTMGDARRGVAGAGGALLTVDIDGMDHIFDPDVLDVADPRADDEQVRLLPGFDEFMLGYKDRSLMLTAEHSRLVVPGGNGMFRSTIVISGRVVGTWKRVLKKARVDILPDVFRPLTAAEWSGVEEAAERYGAYVGLDAVVVRPARH
jgi:hypothetical protein